MLYQSAHHIPKKKVRYIQSGIYYIKNGLTKINDWELLELGVWGVALGLYSIVTVEEILGIIFPSKLV